MIIAFAVAAFVALGVTPFCRRLALALDIVDRPSGRKSHQRVTPYLGGLAIVIGTLVGAVSGGGLGDATVLVILGGVSLAVVGLADDKFSLPRIPRAGVEIGLAVAAYASGIRASVTGHVAVDAFITILWIFGLTNAFNLLDNVDALSSGLAAASCIGIAIAAAGTGQTVVATVAAAVVGGCIGFLAFNAPPASIFMGDTGAYFLGYVVSLLALRLEPRSDPPVSFAVLAMFVAVAVLDTTTVVISRFRRGRSIFLGGTDHLSHRLAARGHSRGMSAALLIGAQAVLALLGATTALRITPSWLAWVVTPAIVGSVAAFCAPVKVYSGEDSTPIAARDRLLRRLAILVVGAVIVVGGPVAWAMAAARGDALAGERSVRQATTHYAAGDAPAAEAAFAMAAERFARAHRTLDHPLVAPAKLVPLLSDNLAAADLLTAEGAALGLTGRSVARATSPGSTRVLAGSVDIAGLARLVDPLDAAVARTKLTNRRLSRIPAGLLLPQLGDAVDRARRETERAVRGLSGAASAARHLPAVLGADDERTYLALVVDLGELRATGGVVTGFAEVRAVAGKVEIGAVRDASELVAKPSAPRPTVDPDFVARYARFGATSDWRNVTMSPDFPTVARVVRALYRDSQGTSVDGVVVVDAIGLAMLQALAEPASSDAELPRAELPDRSALLDRATAVAVSLSARDLAGPGTVTRVLGRASREGHVRAALFDAEGGALVRQLGVDGGARRPAGDSLFAITQGAGSSRVDHELSSNLVMSLQVAPQGNGPAIVTGRLTLSLHNAASSSARHFVSLYTPQSFTGAQVDGRATTLEVADELGRRVHSTYVDTGAGRTSRLRVDLDGTSPLDDGWYDLSIGRQAMARPGRARVTVTAAPGSRIVDAVGIRADRDGSHAEGSVSLAEPFKLRVRLAAS